MFEFTVYQGELLSGSSRRPTNIEVNETGIGIGAFKRTMHSWTDISEITIDGPETSQSRVTATRLVALGVFALAAKKTTSETLVIVTLRSDQVITIMFNKKTEPEVRAIFAPHLRKVAAPYEKKVNENPKPPQKESFQNTKSRAEQLNEIRELLDRGLINENEFRDLKSEILKENYLETNPLLSEKPVNEIQRSVALPPRPAICDGDIDEHGVEHIVRQSIGRVAISVTNSNSAVIESLTELMMSAERTPPDRKTERKWRTNHRNSFIENLGKELIFSIGMPDVERVVAKFEEFGCEVRIALSGTKRLSKGEYKLVEIPNN